MVLLGLLPTAIPAAFENALGQEAIHVGGEGVRVHDGVHIGQIDILGVRKHGLVDPGPANHPNLPPADAVIRDGRLGGDPQGFIHAVGHGSARSLVINLGRYDDVVPLG